MLSRYAANRHRPSYPTRRSSDLKIRSEEARGAWWVEGTGTEPRSRRRPATKSIATGPFRRDGHHFRYRISDRKSTRLNSSHVANSYAVFCLKKKTQKT